MYGIEAMARDPLKILSMLRRHTVEQARQALAARTHEEAQAAARVRMLDDAAEADRRAAMPAEHAHQFLEMAALRQKAIEAQRHIAQSALAAAASRSDQARQQVTAARTAAEAVNTLIEENAAKVEKEADRRAQHALDDIARSPHPAREQHKR